MMSIKVFFFLWMFLGANCWRGYRTDRACTEAGKIVNGSFKESSNRYRTYQCQANYISNIPDLGDIVFKCYFIRETALYEWKATSTWFTDGGFLYLQNVTCEPKKKCSAPPLPKDMTREITTRYLIPVTINSVKKAINDFYTGDTVKYSCKPGLMMSNDSDTSFFSDYISYDEPSSSSTSTTAAPATVLKDITCNADGLWNGFPDSELSFGECQAEDVEKTNGVYTEPGEDKCDCIDGGLKSRKGDQEPKCTPDPCKVPLDFDKHLSIFDKTHASLSGGSIVKVGDIVYFNCSTTDNDTQEPVNRRFICINGQWIENEQDVSWTFGNNGTFPICRKANCEPNCENGGICWKDGYCRCKHLTSGKRCEKVICDDKCYANNGECVGPGECKCPEGKYGANCEQRSCRLPENKNMAKVSTQKTYFAIGETVRAFTCGSGHFPSSDQGMTCRSDGSWSDIITCEKGKNYLISTKTGERIGAGTNANVYITLFGSRGSTRRIKLLGNFESGDVDEIRTFARDVRPIQSVQIGHDGGNWHDISTDWNLEYVSIYVEDMEEFYVFRNIKQQWVMEGNDLTLGRGGNLSCINTFGEKYMWYPRWAKISSFRLGGGLGMTRRLCKQACINWSKNVCNGVYRDTKHHGCYGFSETRDEYFTVKKEPWHGELFFRTCN